MRLDATKGKTAGEFINGLEERELRDTIAKYGEERQAAGIARAIVRERQRGMILTTTQLSEIILTVVRPPYQNKALARVFMALRIKVNQELEQLSRVLPVALSLLNQGGRLAVVCYHSLEDRIVKRFIQREARGVCSCPPGLPDCLCGARPTLIPITSKPVVPSAQEIDRNSRARSARLRVAEKIV
jgi:16S rRNA (cytosine1402-N4)-methyltransferase